jgi:cyclic-di-GMP-binding protein
MALNIPVERAAPAPDLEIRPRNVKRWIESLPLNITFESGRKLCRHLAATNRAHLDADARLEILEAHRAAAAPILQDVESMYASAPLPLAPGPRAALGLARELLTELAIGYRIAIVEFRGTLFSSKKQLGALLLRATQCTAARMFAAYKSYTPVPTATWAELHELYLKAVELGVERDAASSEADGSIADIYCDALLLSLTDPYRLGQGETERVLQLLRAHRGLATLGQARPPTPPGGHFIVPCNTDKPPKPSIAKLDDTGGPDWRLLDANPVVERIRPKGNAADTAKAPATKGKQSSDADLFARLAKLWGDPPKRTSRRDPSQVTVAISMGIDGVGHFVSLERNVDLERQDDMLRRGITMPLAPLPLDDQSEPIPVFEWDVVNESRGGLRVRRVGRTEQPIAIGEVAGIKLPGKPHWAIGAVRWVTVFEDGGMEFGLQYLASMARAVTVSAWGQPSGIGLLLDGEGPTSLLTSPNAFSHIREIELDDHGDAVVVQPSNVVEITHRFELFTVKAP